jgi:hypothetical protein
MSNRGETFTICIIKETMPILMLIIKIRTVDGRKGHTDRTREIRNAYTIPVSKAKEKEPIGRPRIRREDIKINFKQA